MLKNELYTSLKSKFNIAKVDIFRSEQDTLDNILAFVLDQRVLDIKLTSEFNLTKTQTKKIENTLDKLCNKNIPFQYIKGKVFIYDVELIVNKNVLIPRSDTEHLIHEAIHMIEKNGYKTMLDMCTGSGVVGINVAKLTSIKKVDMSDKYASALKVAKKNIDLNNVKAKCSVIKSDIFANVDKTKKYDIITANPPYISKEEYEGLSCYVKNEPYVALVAKDNGLYFYKKIAHEAKQYLNNNGALLFEIGYNEKEAVWEILQDEGYVDITSKKDLNSKDRVIACHFQSK